MEEVLKVEIVKNTIDITPGLEALAMIFGFSMLVTIILSIFLPEKLKKRMIRSIY